MAKANDEPTGQAQAVKDYSHLGPVRDTVAGYSGSPHEGKEPTKKDVPTGHVQSPLGVTKPTEVTGGTSAAEMPEKAKGASSAAVFSDCGTTEPTQVSTSKVM